VNIVQQNNVYNSMNLGRFCALSESYCNYFVYLCCWTWICRER